MKVGYVQNSPVFGKKKENFNEISKLLKGVKADLLVLPELFATGYAFTSRNEVAELAETKEGETAQFLKDISAKTGAVIIGGFIERDGKNNYNSAIMVCEDKTINIYRKIHLFGKEKLWFSPGNKPLSVHDVNGVKIGVMVCFDWNFPEVSRTLALKGAQLIAHPSNLIRSYCQSAMVTRCLENRVFAVTANRVGTEERGEDKFTFTGGSQIVSPDGNVLSSAPKDKAFVNVIKINAIEANDKKINEQNDLFKDRKPEFYELN